VKTGILKQAMGVQKIVKSRKDISVKEFLRNVHLFVETLCSREMKSVMILNY